MAGKEIVVTMAELEREATLEIERRFKALGVDKPVRPARLGAALRGAAHGKMAEFEDEWKS